MESNGRKYAHKDWTQKMGQIIMKNLIFGASGYILRCWTGQFGKLKGTLK